MVKQASLYAFFSKERNKAKSDVSSTNNIACTIKVQDPSLSKESSTSTNTTKNSSSNFFDEFISFSAQRSTSTDETDKEYSDELPSNLHTPESRAVTIDELERKSVDEDEDARPLKIVFEREQLPASCYKQKQKSNKNADFSENGNEYENLHLSEYEKLRLRNIKRNHDRLVALGLVDPSKDATRSRQVHVSVSRPQAKKRKKVKITKATSSTNLPLRRSTRNRNILFETVRECGVSEDGFRTGKPEPSPQQESEEDQFYDSPLVQYSMKNRCKANSSKSTRQQKEKPLSSLVPTGPRLISPKTNLALYSLDIFTSSKDMPIEWVVGAGKSGVVSIWNCSNCYENSDDEIDLNIVSISSWQSHNRKWVADAQFIPSRDLNSSNTNDVFGLTSTAIVPSNLLTAANDGTVCLWDLKQVGKSGSPRNLATTGKSLHTGGIFSMYADIEGSNYNDILVCTGSKDKSLKVTTLESISYGTGCKPMFASFHHGGKVACVQLQGKGNSLVGSASDDGSVAIHDFRCDKVVADIDYAHVKPHSIVWNPCNKHSFISAGYDPIIHSWDIRSLQEPVSSYSGHVPTTTKKCKRIHRPCFLPSLGSKEKDYIISGSENSACLSIFQFEATLKQINGGSKFSVYSRGFLPDGCGDVGCIAANGSHAAVSVDGGEVLLLEPRS